MTLSAKLDAELKAADNAFFDALVDGDLDTLEQVLADAFLIVDVAAGAVHTRADFLGAISEGMVSFESIERFHDEAIVRDLGENAGVVVGRTKMSFFAPDGTGIEASSRYTHVFTGNSDRWQLFSAQGTPIAGGGASSRS
jgi:ketosteroid isomerase-like protein